MLSRNTPRGRDERGVAEEVGLTWLSLPVAAEEVGDARVDEVLALLRAPERTLMFCGDGRASAALFAIHRAAQVGLPLEAAPPSLLRLVLACCSSCGNARVCGALRGFAETASGAATRGVGWFMGGCVKRPGADAKVDVSGVAWRM